MPPAGSWAQFQFRTQSQSQSLNPCSPPAPFPLLFNIPASHSQSQSWIQFEFAFDSAHARSRNCQCNPRVAIFGSLTANDVNLDAPGIPEDANPSRPCLSYTKLYLIGAWSVHREREGEGERGRGRTSTRCQATTIVAHCRRGTCQLSVTGAYGIGLRKTSQMGAHYNLLTSWRQQDTTIEWQGRGRLN